MDLVGYSDSEGSDDELRKDAEKTQPKKDAPSKSGFQKVVDRSDRTKIRVNLPQASSTTQDDTPEEPPAKKAKLGGGGLSGFNAMLPAPKRASVAATGGSDNRTGLKRGVSLKTGAAPGFTREPMQATSTVPEDREDDVGAETGDGLDAPSLRNEELPRASENPTPSSSASTGVQPKGKVTMFRPLSVARKPQKPKVKKTEAAAQGGTDALAKTATNIPDPKPKPKVSLFSTHIEDDGNNVSTSGNAEYQPSIYQTETLGASAEGMDEAPVADASNSYSGRPPSHNDSQSLDSIASDLDLSAADRRRLFGRSGKSTNINVTTFNTDAEYAANEVLRANQDQNEAARPVRAIAPGKHSLRQLLNSAVSQKDALEEQFATGRRNKKEAGSRYGW